MEVKEWAGWRWHVGAICLYAALSVALIDGGASITRNILGLSSDPLLFIWFLAWWPFALAHHLPPLYSTFVWQPVGIDLVWTNCIPCLALLAAPVTLLGGPVLAYNLLNLLAPVLAAAGGYALCLYITRNALAAMFGGLAYGFSTYEMSESVAHMNLDFNAAVPCLLLVVLVRLDGRLGRPAAAILAALAISVQFYISEEIAATMLIFGGVAWALALLLLAERRVALWRLVADGLLAGLFTLLLTMPILWNVLTVRRGVEIPIGWAYVSAGHLFNLLVTNPRVVLSSPSMAFSGTSLIGRFPQWDFTTGIPLAVILGWYAWTGWPRGDVKLCCFMLAIIMLASLGPQLWTGARFTGIVMPWYYVLRVPFINTALPVRFMLYSSLILAIIVAKFVATGGGARTTLQGAFAVFAVAITLTQPHPSMRAPYLHFFRPGRVEAVLGARPRLLILPGTVADVSGFLQAENGFGFVQTTGYLGMPPLAIRHFQAVSDIMFDQDPVSLSKDLAAFCFATHTGFVVAGPGVRPEMVRAMEALAWPQQRVNDVTVFTVPGAVHG